MADLSAVDNFISDVSDQAAAWYAMVTNTPAQIPSATIMAQQNAAVLAAPTVTAVSLFSSPGVLLLILAVIVLLLWKRA